jgi:hypothetical protein
MLHELAQSSDSSSVGMGSTMFTVRARELEHDEIETRAEILTSFHLFYKKIETDPADLPTLKWTLLRP